MNWKLASALIAILILAGCTTMKPVEMSPDQLHDQISSGDIVGPGDQVKLFTSDGKTHELKVSAITDTSIVGDDIEVPIDDVIAMETKEFSGGDTSVLVLSSTLVLGFIVLVGLSGLAVGL
jgi:hypothetical protein